MPRLRDGARSGYAMCESRTDLDGLPRRLRHALLLRAAVDLPLRAAGQELVRFLRGQAALPVFVADLLVRAHRPLRGHAHALGRMAFAALGAVAPRAVLAVLVAVAGLCQRGAGEDRKSTR